MKKTLLPRSLSQTVSAVEISPIKQFELMARSKNDIISLAQGIPSFLTAGHIRNAAKDAIDHGLTDKYTPSSGIEPLRTAMASKIRRDNKIHTSSSQILVTHGATEALFAVFLALLEPGDEVIMPTPGYGLYINDAQIALNGKKPTYVPFKQNSSGWELDVEIIEKNINSRTKAIVFSNPSNPTGMVFSYEELKSIANLAVKYNLYIVSDEIYEYFTFGGKRHISIGSFDEVSDRTISIFGVSKSYAMTGWRIGYISASQALIDQIFKVHDTIITCPTVVAQYAALAAITGPQDNVNLYRETFLKRRQITLSELSKTDKLQTNPPDGTYYIFPKFKNPLDDVKVSMDLLNKAKVAVVPGSAFGKGGENHIRISFGCEEQTLRLGLQRLVHYLNSEL